MDACELVFCLRRGLIYFVMFPKENERFFCVFTFVQDHHNPLQPQPADFGIQVQA